VEWVPDLYELDAACPSAWLAYLTGIKDALGNLNNDVSLRIASSVEKWRLGHLRDTPLFPRARVSSATKDARLS
jgi:hypothetical protein